MLCFCSWCIIATSRQRFHTYKWWLTTHPVESSLRSAMQRKLRLQPPLSLVQSLTGPKESSRTSRESKDELIISSSLFRNKQIYRTQNNRTSLVVSAAEVLEQPTLVAERKLFQRRELFCFVFFLVFKARLILCITPRQTFYWNLNEPCFISYN